MLVTKSRFAIKKYTIYLFLILISTSCVSKNKIINHPHISTVSIHPIYDKNIDTVFIDSSLKAAVKKLQYLSAQVYTSI